MMTSKEILEKYLDFYGKRGHKLVPNVSLIPENDSTILYVNSGMFPLVPYLMGEEHPLGKRLMNVQRALRFEDLEEIGDFSHTIGFHMIGNWSLGDYFKDEQLPWAYQFLIEELGIDIDKIYATVFEGDTYAPRDTDSIKIIEGIFRKYKPGITEKELHQRIFSYGREDNWWKRGDAVGELGGPDSEIFYYIGEGTGLGLSPAEHKDTFLEIGNNVFMQYKKGEHDSWEELPKKNVDFGGGLERLALVMQGKKDIYETDNFYPIIQKIEEISGKKYGENEVSTKAMRIIADHLRSTTFLAMDGVIPSNKDQGYILRRLLRRMVVESRKLGVTTGLSKKLVPTVVSMFSWLYPDLLTKQEHIEEIFGDEESRFSQTLIKASHSVSKYLQDFAENKKGEEEDIAKQGFEFYQSLGYPIDIFIDEIKALGLTDIDHEAIHTHYKEIFNSHQEKSRKGMEKKFKGGLADHSETVIQYHTATHLLHASLRKILGEHVSQQGSNITKDRLRFDFTNTKKLTDKEVHDIQDMINEKIQQDLSVHFEILDREKAEKTGALHFFKEKYGDNVKVYYIGDNLDTAFSKEFCGGPHVSHTGELKPLEIYKQEFVGKGILRVYAKFIS